MQALVIIPIIAIIIAFCTMCNEWNATNRGNQNRNSAPCGFAYEYSPVSKYPSLDHKYSFSIVKIGGGYRCYIDRIPSFRGRSTAHYQYHFLSESGSHRRYICWTGVINSIEKAKTLCRNWADATQQFIDTGVPAKGFEG